jgi:hypothetical protein
MARKLTITIPENLADYAEESWVDRKISFICVGTGCGSSEYEFPSLGAFNRARTAVEKAVARDFDPKECIVEGD